jgi:hypothetical protein
MESLHEKSNDLRVKLQKNLDSVNNNFNNFKTTKNNSNSSNFKINNILVSSNKISLRVFLNSSLETPSLGNEQRELRKTGRDGWWLTANS